MTGQGFDLEPHTSLSWASSHFPPAWIWGWHGQIEPLSNSLCFLGLPTGGQGQARPPEPSSGHGGGVLAVRPACPSWSG